MRNSIRGAIFFLLSMVFGDGGYAAMSSTQKQCVRALMPPRWADEVDHEIAQLTDGAVNPSFKGPMAEIENLLALSKLPSDHASFVSDMVLKLVYSEHEATGVLSYAGLVLNRIMANQEELLLCVLNENCKLKNGSSAYISKKHNFVIRPFYTTIGRRPRDEHVFKFKSKEGVTQGLQRQQPSVIVIDGGRHIQAQHLALRLIHEITHFADLDLIEKWIEINGSAENQATTDKTNQLFERNVRRNKEGQWEVDEGFLLFFLETRAQLAEIEGLKPYVSEARYEDLVELQTQLTLESLKKNWLVTQRFIEQNNISKKNILALGQEMGERIQQDIQQGGLR